MPINHRDLDLSVWGNNKPKKSDGWHGINDPGGLPFKKEEQLKEKKN